MIEFGKITGEVNRNLLQVRMRNGECLFAPMAIVGTDVSIPSTEWVSANKDNFLALVAFEKDIHSSPMVIGFYPVKGAESSSYNTTERLLSMVAKLVEQLLAAKVNTLMGPQPFMPDTLKVLNEVKEELSNIQKLILPLNL